MKTKKTSSFIVEVPLHTSSKEETVLRKRFWAARQPYHALLGEALKRVKKVRSDSDSKMAHQLYKDPGKKREAKELWKRLHKNYGFREYDLYSFCKQSNQKTNPLKIGAIISQKITKRVFDVVQKYRLKMRVKPRFKGFRGLGSIEDNRIDGNLRIKENDLHYLGITLPLLWNFKDALHCHGKITKHKYVRLVKKKINERERYFAQTVCEGVSLIKEKNLPTSKVIGLDLGLSTIAIVCAKSQKATITPFADKLKENTLLKKKLQKQIAKKLSIGNPKSFHSDSFEKKDKHWLRKLGGNKNKPSQRWHKCHCGVAAQRDRYSAYLANFVENDKLIVDQAQKSWSGMDIALRTAMSELKQASSGSIPTSLGLSACRANSFLNCPEAPLQAFVRGRGGSRRGTLLL